MDNRSVIHVPNNELGMKRAYKEAAKAKEKGKQLAFDLRQIENRKGKVDFIMMTKDI